MAALKQVAASRQNGRKGGPRTPEARAAVRNSAASTAPSRRPSRPRTPANRPGSTRNWPRRPRLRNAKPGLLCPAGSEAQGAVGPHRQGHRASWRRSSTGCRRPCETNPICQKHLGCNEIRDLTDGDEHARGRCGTVARRGGQAPDCVFPAGPAGGGRATQTGAPVLMAEEQGGAQVPCGTNPICHNNVSAHEIRRKAFHAEGRHRAGC
jgi:hypothetical protein